MTDALPPYGTAEHCPKCLCPDINDQYRPRSPQIVWGPGGELNEVTTHGGEGTGPECLLRTCQRCGWAWLEACADSEQNDEPGNDPDEPSSDFYRRIGAVPATTLDTP